jgi:hypothetical protein
MCVRIGLPFCRVDTRIAEVPGRLVRACGLGCWIFCLADPGAGESGDRDGRGLSVGSIVATTTLLVMTAKEMAS